MIEEEDEEEKEGGEEGGGGVDTAEAETSVSMPKRMYIFCRTKFILLTSLLKLALGYRLE